MLKSAIEDAKQKKQRLAVIILIDVIVVILGAAGIAQLRNHFVPLDLRPNKNRGTNVRAILDTNSKEEYTIPVGKIVTAIGETDEWYFLSYKPFRAVHKSAMEVVEKGLLDQLSRIPIALILSLLVLSWWPRLRSWIWNGPSHHEELSP